MQPKKPQRASWLRITHRSLDKLRVVSGGADGEGHILSLGNCGCLLQGAAAEFRLAEAHALLECDAGRHRHGGHRCENVRNLRREQFQAQARVERMRRSSCGPACVWRRDNEAPGYIPLPARCVPLPAGRPSRPLIGQVHSRRSLRPGAWIGQTLRGGCWPMGASHAGSDILRAFVVGDVGATQLKALLHLFRGLESQNTSVNLGFFSTYKEDGKFGTN